MVTRMSARQAARIADGGDGRLERVMHDAEVGHLGAFRARQRRERKAVGIDDLPRPGLGARRHQFVAGGEQRNARPAIAPATADGSCRRRAGGRAA